MTEREHPGNTKERDVARSTEDIRQDIAKEKRTFPRQSSKSMSVSKRSWIGADM